MPTSFLLVFRWFLCLPLSLIWFQLKWLVHLDNGVEPLDTIWLWRFQTMLGSQVKSKLGRHPEKKIKFKTDNIGIFKKSVSDIIDFSNLLIPKERDHPKTTFTDLGFLTTYLKVTFSQIIVLWQTMNFFTTGHGTHWDFLEIAI